MEGGSPPTYGVPPAASHTALLIVFLWESDTASQHHLVANFQRSFTEDVDIRVWCPSLAVLRSVAAQGSRRDSLANIHAVSILAYRAGWSSLVVADRLTERQLRGEAQLGERDFVTVVMVAVRPVGTGQGQVRVVARRSGYAESKHGVLLQTLSTLELPARLLGYEENTPFIFEELGLELQDPGRPVFAPDQLGLLAHEEVRMAVHEVLAMKGHLPLELHSPILRATEDNIDDLIPELPRPTSPRGTRRDLFVFFPTTDSSFDDTDNIVKELIAGAEARLTGDEYLIAHHLRLRPWPYPRPMSRCDLMRVWANVNEHYLDGLAQPISPADPEATQFLVMWDDTDRERHAVVREPLDVMMRPRSPKTNRVRAQLDNGEPLDCPHEILHNPGRPFYVDVPEWISVDPELCWTRFFYLTNQLTPEQDQALRREILTPMEHTVDAEGNTDKHAVFVPWQRETSDGSLDSVWNIFWKVWQYEREHLTHYTVAGRHCGVTCFIDQQSFLDHTVLIVDGDYTSSGESALYNRLGLNRPTSLRGFDYARVSAREAHWAFDEIHSHSVFLDEMDLASGIQSHIRPDWPRELVLQFLDSDSD